MAWTGAPLVCREPCTRRERWWVAALLPLPALAVWLARGLSTDGPLLVAAVTVLASAGLLRHFGARGSLTADADGLVERTRLGTVRTRCAWAEIEVVEPLPDGGVRIVRRAGLPLLLRHPLKGWATLAERVAEALGESAPAVVAETGHLPAATIEQWLGLGPGGELRVPGDAGDVGSLGLLLLYVGTGMLAMLCSLSWAPLLWVAQLALLAPPLVRWVQRRQYDTAPLAAGGHQLVVRDARGRHRCSWGALRGIEQRGERIFVTTTDDSFQLDRHLWAARAVLATIHRVLAARAAGQLAADEQDVPAGALSLARLDGDTADSERGLSRAGLQ